MIAIIDYGMGNVASVQKVLNFLKIDNVITSDEQTIEKCGLILLPGVGSFEQGMKNLRDKNLDQILTREVLIKKKKFLGICLGMQLVSERGTEPIDCEGLGWIKGSVEKIENIPLRIPHMGWNSIASSEEQYLNELSGKDFYFTHSYHFIPSDKNVIAATVNYGRELVAAIHKDNIFATQFHPEKSQDAGIALLKSFFEINA